MSRLRALSLAAGLVGWSLVSPRLPAPWRIPLQAGLGSVLVLVTRATMGLWPPRLWAGLRLGWAAGAAAATAIAQRRRCRWCGCRCRLVSCRRRCRSGWYGTYLAARCGPRRPRFAGRWPLSVPGPSVGRVDGYCRPAPLVCLTSPTRARRASRWCSRCWPPVSPAGCSVGWPTVRQSGSTAADALGHQRGRCGRRGAGPAAFWYLDSTVIAGSGPW